MLSKSVWSMRVPPMDVNKHMKKMMMAENLRVGRGLCICALRERRGCGVISSGKSRIARKHGDAKTASSDLFTLGAGFKN